MSIRTFLHLSDGKVYTWDPLSEWWQPPSNAAWRIPLKDMEVWLAEAWWPATWQEITDLELDEGL